MSASRPNSVSRNGTTALPHRDGKRSEAAVAGGTALQFATFSLGDHLFGIEVLRVQEVLRDQAKSRIPLAPPHVAGLINLRGQIVTLLDLRTRLGLSPKENNGKAPMNVVVNAAEGPVSLMVDAIGDVLEVSREDMEPPPLTMSGKMAEYIESVCKLKGRLLVILNVGRLLDSAKA